MISRRLLRIKVAKTIYGHLQTPDRTLAQSEKELLHSIKKFNDLYHLLLGLVVEVADYSQSRIDIGKQKHRPSAEELKPNTRFVNNAVINLLRNNEPLSTYLHAHRLSWVNYPELVKKLYTNMSEKEYYQNYLNGECCTFTNDKQLVIAFLTQEIEDFADIYSCLEEQSIFWMDEVEFVLGMVIKTVKGFKENQSANTELMPLYKDLEDEDFATRLLRRAVIKRSDYLELIGQHSSNWEVERIAFMDTVIMLTGIAEIVEFPTIPIKVSFNEYIDLAKLYSTPNSASFVNGVLDKIIIQMKEQNMVIKQGKGLLEEPS